MVKGGTNRKQASQNQRRKKRKGPTRVPVVPDDIEMVSETVDLSGASFVDDGEIPGPSNAVVVRIY